MNRPDNPVPCPCKGCYADPSENSCELKPVYFINGMDSVHHFDGTLETPPNQATFITKHSGETPYLKELKAHGSTIQNQKDKK
jgi:hypothetical protein